MAKFDRVTITDKEHHYYGQYAYVLAVRGDMYSLQREGRPDEPPFSATRSQFVFVYDLRRVRKFTQLTLYPYMVVYDGSSLFDSSAILDFGEISDSSSYTLEIMNLGNAALRITSILLES